MRTIVRFGEFLKISSLRSNSVTRQVILIGQTLGENAKIQGFKCDILSNFQTMCRFGHSVNDKVDLNIEFHKLPVIMKLSVRREFFGW